MRTATYNDLIRDFISVADSMSRYREGRSYDYARNGGHNGQNGHTLRLPLDAYATEEAFVINTYLPGVNPDEVQITFEGEELTIRGKFEPAPQDVSFIKRELYHGPFERRLTFNVPVNPDGIEAVFEGGMLTLTVPKAEAIKPKQIKVQAR